MNNPTTSEPLQREHSGGRPSREAAAQIRGRILEVARLLFLRDGYEMTSMDAISAELGMSKRTLYARFPGKADLFEAMVANVLERHLTALEEADLTGRSLREQLSAIADRLLASSLDPDMVALERVVTAEARRFPRLAQLIHNYAADRTVGLVANVLRSGSGKGISREQVLRDAKIFLGLMILPSLRGAVLGTEEFGTGTEGAALRQRSMDIFLAGAGYT